MPEAILPKLMVSTVQFLALKKEKAAKFLKPVSYQFSTGSYQTQHHELDEAEMFLWIFNGPE